MYKVDNQINQNIIKIIIWKIEEKKYQSIFSVMYIVGLGKKSQSVSRI